MQFRKFINPRNKQIMLIVLKKKLSCGEKKLLLDNKKKDFDATLNELIKD